MMENFSISNHLESLFVQINCSGFRKVVIGIIYRPPREYVSAFLDDFSDMLNDMNGDRYDCFITGDFNINLLSGQNANLFKNTKFIIVFTVSYN